MKEKLMTPQGIAQLSAAHSGYENAQILLAAQQWEDALACLVLESPPKQTLGWLLQQILKAGTSSAAERLCADDIGRWIGSSDEALRRDIFRRAEALGFDTPLGALGLAAFWMQGSMTPDEFEAVYPEPHLAPLMLHCAMKLLSVSLAGDGAPHAGAQALFAEWSAARGTH